MHYKNSFIAFSFFSGLLLSSCTTATKDPVVEDIPGLKDVFANDFLIGTALSASQIEEKDARAVLLVPKHFNAATPENIMKAEVLQPEWGQYNFSHADQLVEYAKKNNLQLNGHTLIWHSQLPVFAKQIQSVDSFRIFFTNHINTVASRYNGKLQSWDVINEALNEDGTLRQTPFLEKLGDDYLTEAFRLTAQASPGTDLYYNDYNNEQPAKRAGCIALIKKIQAAGVKIDGVGIQGHWQLGKIPLQEIEKSIVEYAALGIKVAFTELDIEVLPRNFQGADISSNMEANAQSNPYVNGLPDSVQQQLAKDYESLFRLFFKHKEKIERVTFWGVHDEQSWLNGWPILGRTNYPLLFDREGKPKPAFFKVIATKK